MTSFWTTGSRGCISILLPLHSKVHIFIPIFSKPLLMSKKSSTFAADFKFLSYLGLSYLGENDRNMQ